MAIQVKLKNGVVTVQPLHHAVGKGEHTVFWRSNCNSDGFTFDTPAVTFAGGPFSKVTSDGDVASALDVNPGGSTDADYTYQLHLIGPDGKKITYPDAGSTGTVAASDGKIAARSGTYPTIKNKPN